MTFYRDSMGLYTQGIAEGFNDHVLFELQEGLSLVLFLRSEMEKLSGEPPGTKSSSECILSYAADSIVEVDKLVERAVAGGATLCSKPEQQPWGYFAYFKDPDGHLWEIITGPAAQ
jgi:uncharacterized protein